MEGLLKIQASNLKLPTLDIPVSNPETFEVSGLRPEALPSGTASNLKPHTSNALALRSTLTSLPASNLQPHTSNTLPLQPPSDCQPEQDPQRYQAQLPHAVGELLHEELERQEQDNQFGGKETE